MYEAPATAPMELRDYFGILRRRAWVIILVTAIVVGAAAAWSFSRPNEYEASGTLVVSTSGSNNGDVGNQADIIQSQAVHAIAEQASPGVDGVTANAGTTGGSITVTSTNRNPAQAARTVNAHVDAYLAYLRQQAQHQFDVLNQTLQPQIASLQQQIAALDQQIALAAAGVGPPNPVAATQRSALSAQLAPLQTQLQNSSIGVALAGQDVQVVSRATPPTQRTSPDPKTDLLVALGAGLLLGVAVAFLLEFLDDSIREPSGSPRRRRQQRPGHGGDPGGPVVASRRRLHLGAPVPRGGSVPITPHRGELCPAEGQQLHRDHLHSLPPG